jgi:hypothetical protein
LSDECKEYCKHKKIPYNKVSKRIHYLKLLLDELEISLEDLMHQFEVIKHQYDIKLYDVDLEFLMNDDGDDDISSAIQQMM